MNMWMGQVSLCESASFCKVSNVELQGEDKKYGTVHNEAHTGHGCIIRLVKLFLQ